MKKKNKRVVRYKSHINLNAGIVIFGLISIYLLINIVIYFTTERTAFYEVISGSNAQEANVSYNGIAIRNEIVQSARDSGYIDYYVREGSRVSLNTTLYSIDSTGELNNLLSEASKKNPKLSSDNIDTLAGLISDYCNNYNEMNYSEIYNFKTSLKGTVVDLINMNSLENIAKEEGNTFSINNSASTGIVLYRIDNYENLKPKNLKASLFDKNSYVDVKFSSGTKTEKGNPIYKTVNDEEWSIAVQFTKKEAKKYKKVNGVKIKFLKDGLTTTANIK
ncbi:MAG: HlyD family efflux transporter periplasmic adaptor subunit, partial [Eubacterium ventriosum]